MAMAILLSPVLHSPTSQRYQRQADGGLETFGPQLLLGLEALLSDDNDYLTGACLGSLAHLTGSLIRSGA